VKIEVKQNLLCKRPCTQTTYEVEQMPVIKTNDFEIGLNFELSVEVTWNRFSSSIWDVLTGFGGSVRTAWSTFSHNLLIYFKNLISMLIYLK
jgi:hypothetical protein